jgi:hypothetical protein
VRISDARYSRDLRRYQLAWRLIRHGARTRTVERWSGLSMYRVRTLYGAYATGAMEHPRSPLRGVAPHQVSFFFRSAHLKCEAAVLAGLLKSFGVCPEAPPDKPDAPLENLGRGEQLCRAYEEFKAYWPTAQSTLEHAILLLTELTRGVEIALARCMTCDVLIVIDRLAIAPPRCAYCAYELQAGLPFIAETLAPPECARTGPEGSEGLQGSLF